MYCKNCGVEAKETDKYCNNCGTKLEDASDIEKIDSTEIQKKLEPKENLKANVFDNSMSKIINSEKKDMESEYTQVGGVYKNNYSGRKKKKIILAVTLAVVLLLLSVGVYALFNKDKIFYSNKGKRTIMIYMIGSDLESKYLSATKDINEILNSDIDYDDINILLYTGGAKKWYTDGIPNDKQALFEIDNNGLRKIGEYDSTTDMLDLSNITFLLDYGYENYDTEYYDLILWDHGAGPIYGYGYDEYNKIDSISVNELKEALKNSPFNGANKLELVGFDACLMSSIEIASVLSDYSEYMVASQEFEPSNGWNYEFLEKVDSSTSSLEMGEKIVDYYSDYYEEKSYIKGVSLSLLKLNKVENVEKSIDELFNSIEKGLLDEFSTISRTRNNSKSFGKIANEEYYYDLVDLKDFINQLPEKYYEKVNSLKASLEDLVVYQKTDLKDTYGVSIYFPYENKKEIKNSMAIYSSIDFVESYLNFVSEFATKLTGNKIYNWNISKSNIKAEKEGVVSITLPNDVMENYSSASYIIFQKSNDEFIPILNSTDVVVDGNKISTTTAKKTLVAKNKDGESMSLTAIESEKGLNYTKYFIPATLSKWDPKTFDYEIIAVYIEFVVDEEHPNGYVSVVLPMDVNENYTYKKTEIDLKEWSFISLLGYKYSILDKDGKYVENWQNSDELISIDFQTDEDLNIYFTDLDISYHYYCVFRIKDSQGNSYYSNIVEVNNK